jgi:hypothetical protein
MIAFGYFTRPVLAVSPGGLNRASTNKAGGCPWRLLVTYLGLPIEQDFQNSTGAIAAAQPEVNHFTRRKTWQQN